MPKIIVFTTKAQVLRDAIFNAVEQEELPTWQIRTSTSKDSFLTHTGQWTDRAILRFNIYDDRLEIIPVRWDNREEDSAAKKYYIGRFTEMLLIHFDKHFTDFTVRK